MDERVEATVEFPRGISFPRLCGIRFRGAVVEFSSPMRVDQTSSALLYRARASGSEYAVRFEVARQIWVLEAVREAPSLP